MKGVFPKCVVAMENIKKLLKCIKRRLNTLVTMFIESINNIKVSVLPKLMLQIKMNKNSQKFFLRELVKLILKMY